MYLEKPLSYGAPANEGNLLREAGERKVRVEWLGCGKLKNQRNVGAEMTPGAWLGDIPACTSIPDFLVTILALAGFPLLYQMLVILSLLRENFGSFV